MPRDRARVERGTAEAAHGLRPPPARRGARPASLTDRQVSMHPFPEESWRIGATFRGPPATVQMGAAPAAARAWGMDG